MKPQLTSARLKGLLQSTDAEEALAFLNQPVDEDPSEFSRGIEAAARWWIRFVGEGSECLLPSLMAELPPSEEAVIGAISFIGFRIECAEAYREAAELLVRTFPRSARAWYHRALLLLEHAEEKEAFRACERSLQQEKTPAAFLLGIEISQVLGNGKRARWLALRGVRHFPKNPDLHHQLGIMWSGRFDFVRAFKHFDKAIANGGDAGSVAWDIAIAGLEAKQVAQVKKAQDLAVDSPLLHEPLAIMYDLVRGDIDAAAFRILLPETWDVPDSEKVAYTFLQTVQRVCERNVAQPDRPKDDILDKLKELFFTHRLCDEYALSVYRRIGGCYSRRLRWYRVSVEFRRPTNENHSGPFGYVRPMEVIARCSAEARQIALDFVSLSDNVYQVVDLSVARKSWWWERASGFTGPSWYSNLSCELMPEECEKSALLDRQG